MYLLYNLAIWVGSPLLVLWLAVRRVRGRLPGLAERLGFFPKLANGNGPAVWFHAVSLGEVKVASALAEQLRTRAPGIRVVLTSSTRTGWEEARRRAAPDETVLFPPMDYAWICRRFLRRVRPDVVVILETELWPNLFREAKRFGAGLLLVNGRISDRSFPRYRATRLFWHKVLAYPDALFAQSARDAERFRAVGAPPARLRVAANLKFAARPAVSAFVGALQAKLRASGVGPILVAGSTMPGEEKLVLEAFLQLRREFPALFLILAPRHPERFAAVAGEVRSAGIPMQLRSEWREETTPGPGGVLLLDSTGELGAVYGLATAAFVGGTLVPTGGHNVLEPAHFACPTVIGPSMENFQEIARQFLEAGGAGRIPDADGIRTGAVVQVQNVSGLVAALRFLFANPAFARRLGESARELSRQQLSGIEPLLRELQDRLMRTPVAKTLQTPLGQPTNVSAEKWQEAAK